jgi:GTP-binding protein Era
MWPEIILGEVASFFCCPLCHNSKGQGNPSTDHFGKVAMNEMHEETNELYIAQVAETMTEDVAEVQTDGQPDALDETLLPEGHKSGFVAIVGSPNVGKSTLMNALLNQKIAIVGPRPQTTRTRQLGIMTTENYQIVFVDLPGFVHKARHELDTVMVGTVTENAESADLIIWLVDGTQRPTEADQAVANLLHAHAGKMPVIVAINKIDVMSAEQVATHPQMYTSLLPDAAWLVFSGGSGAGVGELLTMIIERLPEGPRFYPEDQITETFVRTIAAEMVREQLLIQLDEEVPHAAAVEVEEYKERENGMIYVRATIHVERDSHKKIVIGQGGRQVRQIGMAARKEIEKLVEAPVYLELFVRVTPKWRQNRHMLEQLGYARSN